MTNLREHDFSSLSSSTNRNYHRPRSTSRSQRRSSRSRSSSRRRQRPTTEVNADGRSRDERRGSNNGNGRSKASRSTKVSRSTKSSRSIPMRTSRSRSFHETSSRASKFSRSTATTTTSRSSTATPRTFHSFHDPSRCSVDPDGQVFDNSFHHPPKANGDGEYYPEDDFSYSTRSQRLDEVASKVSEVETYAVRARKKASLMTNYDFERGDDDEDDLDGDEDKNEVDGYELIDYDDISKQSRRRRGSKSDNMTRERRRSSRSPSRSMESYATRSRKSYALQSRQKSSTSTSRSRKPTRSKSSSRRSCHSPSQEKSRSKSKTSSHRAREYMNINEEESIPPATIPAEDQHHPISPHSYQEDDATPDMTGATIGGTYTTVSSMTSTDSYVKHQKYVEREMKMRELEAQRERREERKRKAEKEGYFYEGEDATVLMEEGDHDSFCSEEGDHTRCHSDVKSPERPSSQHSSRRRRRSSNNESNSRRSGSDNKSRRSNNNGSKSGSNRTPISHDSTPVYQREESCIKHPDVLLTDQTDVHVWTCMKYCKDVNTGRWHTVKMVCEECLAEDEDCHRYDTPFHRKFRRDLRGFRPLGYGIDPSNLDPRSPNPRNHGHDDYSSSSSVDMSDDDDDETCSSSSQSYDPNHYSQKDTINVHPMADQTPLEREAEAQRRRFVRRLAARAYHFPGNTWCEDWIQYISNTHLVFGIFFHHPLHPVRSTERCVILLGSVAVGLLMSNLIYLWFVHANIGMDDTVLSLGPGGSLDISKLIITLWTLGSMAHTLFDLSIWHIKACTLCRYGREDYVSDNAVKCGRTAGLTIVLMTFAFATYLVLLRASEDYNEDHQLGIDNEQELNVDDDYIVDTFIQPISLGGGAKYFAFLLGYIIEFVLAVFVYNPLILTVLFAGILGCNGRIPILGGRPREVMNQQRYAMKRQRYTMPHTLKLGGREYVAEGMWRNSKQNQSMNF